MPGKVALTIVDLTTVNAAERPRVFDTVRRADVVDEPPALVRRNT
jgi:hypothetical protein